MQGIAQQWKLKSEGKALTAEMQAGHIFVCVCWPLNCLCHVS